MPAFVFILETAVDDHDVVEPVVELSVHEFHQDVLLDARQCVGLVLGNEVRKLKARSVVDFPNRLEWCI